MSLTKNWGLPKPPKSDTLRYHQVVRYGRTIPFGYSQNPDDPDILDPIPEELDLLEKAKEHLRKYSLRDVANWLTATSGRSISHEGLRKRLKLEQRRKRDATNAKLYAERYKAALKKAEKIEEKLGGKAFTVSTDSE